MKTIRRVIAWIMLSLILQVSGLFYLDKFYFITEKEFVEVAPRQPAKVVEKKEIPIPETAKNITISFDGKYASYYEGEELKVIDTQSAAVKSVQFSEGIKVSFCKWLPDRDRMIIAEKKEKGLSFSTYDVKRNEKTEVKDELNNKKVYINLPDDKSEVEDIALSTLTNMIYVKVAHGGKRNSVYSINVMSEMKKVNTVSYVMGAIGIAPHEANLIYEDLTYKKVHITGSTKPMVIKDAASTCLLGIDEEDTVFLGDEENGSIKRIASGLSKDSMDKWKIIQLSSKVDKKDLYISQQGKIYANDNLKGTVTEVGTGKETSYIGSFLQMYNGGVASISEEKLIKTEFKK